VTVEVFGVRHHGPGSARSLVEDLGRLAPDCVLIEGPPDANALIPLAAAQGMKPPVALLVYDPEAPRDAAFYPFAVFSPEWQAIRFGLGANVPVRFIDLAVGAQLAIGRVLRAKLEAEEAADETAGETADNDSDAQAAADHRPGDSGLGDDDSDEGDADASDPPTLDVFRTDPLGELARAAGEPDGERWWDRLVESRRSAADVFAAIREAMTAVRTELPDEDPSTMLREAAMRREIRSAEAAGHERIAVVCGAWHVPALVDRPPAAADDRLLKGMPRPVKTAAAWVPWTYSRLAAESGYGAGIISPGWYEHLWSGREPLTISWMARVARVFRAEDLDISSAHLIEAARLADALAALRGRAIPSLDELTEAVRAVAAFGSDIPLAVVRDRLVVGRTMGRIPDDAPIAPLAADLGREQRRLRLKPEEGKKPLDLDLRTDTDLGRSHLLHRLRLIDVPWGSPQRLDGGKAGTFHELWSLTWKPEFAVELVAASRYGTTIVEAAGAKAIEDAAATDRLAELTLIAEGVLLADLPAAIEAVVARIGVVAAVAADVPSLMAALPPLARVGRYGNVRGTDAESVRVVVDGLVARICVGLGAACASLDDSAAAELLPLLASTDAAVALLDDAEQRAAWHAAVGGIAEQAGVHGLIAGRACRILVDGHVLDADEARLRLGRALSRGAEPAVAAAWIDGFLRDSGLVLVHDDALFDLIDGWVAGLGPEAFEAVLPLVRRTTATFSAPERRAIGERAKGAAGTVRAGVAVAAGGHDAERGALVLPILATILGLDRPKPRP
jgi:uncharacterized protein DUF5682